MELERKLEETDLTQVSKWYNSWYVKTTTRETGYSRNWEKKDWDFVGKMKEWFWHIFWLQCVGVILGNRVYTGECVRANVSDVIKGRLVFFVSKVMSVLV